MNILVVCQYYYPEQFRINDICKHLVRDGHSVTVLTGLPNYPGGKVSSEYRWFRKRKEIINGVRVIRCFEIGRGKGSIHLALNYLSFMISASLRALFIGKDFDIVFINQLSPITMVVPAIVYKKTYNKKLFLYCLDLWPDSIAAAGIQRESVIYNLLYRVSKKIYNYVDKIAVTSKSFSIYFEKVLKIRSHNIVYLPQYAEKIFDKVEVNRPDKNVTNLVFAGNIGEMQSVETIVLAANELKQREDIQFHVVGGGSLLGKCKQLSKDLNLANIRFYGQRPLTEMPGFYKLADAMLITLKKNEFISYTLPGKIQTYMAVGKPILGSIDGEAKRVIDDAQCGLCCEAEDYNALAGIIDEFIRDKSKQKQYSENSYKYYRENFNELVFFEKLYSLFSELMEEQPCSQTKPY